MRQNTVLIVDDEADIRLSLELILRIFDFDVALAANGQEALDYLHSHEAPCIIILDLRMPVMGGVRFREEQLRDPELAKVPVIVISAEINLATRADLGNVSICSKPADPMKLVQMIQQRCA